MFSSVTEIFTSLIDKYGILGVGMAMFAESAGVPYASAIAILSAGRLITHNKISYWGAIFFSTAGIIVGSMFSYFLGYLGRKVGKKLNGYHRNIVGKKNQSFASNFLKKYGCFSIFCAQLFGVTRTFISFPAGAVQLNFLYFILYTALGGVLFSTAAVSFSFIMTRFINLLWPVILLAPVIILVLLVVIIGFIFWLRHRQVKT